MWILVIPDAPGAGLVAHERWLRPGSTVTIGRKEDNDVSVRGAKSVSKQHVAILVGAVTPGSSSNVSTRGRLTIKDLGATFKTFLTIGAQTVETTIDGEHDLTAESTTIRLGKAIDIIFKIYWQPFVFALSGIKSKDVQGAFDTLDLKYQKDYSDLTTHVVTNKFNTPKCLQALTCGKYIVGTEYVHAMVTASEQLTLSMQALPSAIDTKFLPNDDFSKEFGHEVFFPKQFRDHAYESLEFVFFDKTQHKSLSPPVSHGHGKSLLYTEQFSKKSISAYLQELKKPIVVLTLDEEQTEVLDQVVSVIEGISVTQGDFIRILLSDGTHEVFQAQPTKPWPASSANVIPAVSEIAPPVQEDLRNQDSSSNTGLQTQPSASQAGSKRIGSRPIKILANFEDDLFGFTEPVASQKHVKSTIGKAQSRGDASSSQRTLDNIDDIFDTAPPAPQLGSQRGTLRRQNLPLDLHLQPHQDTDSDSMRRLPRKDSQVTTIQSSQKKVRVNDTRDEPFYTEYEVAPAAAALAKKMSETQNSSLHNDSQVSQAARHLGQSTTEPDAATDRAEITEEAIQATLKASKRRAELASQVEDDGEERPANNELRNLGTVEFFPLALKDITTTTGASKDRSERWDPKWNGRKNFKKFRRTNKSASETSTTESTRPQFMIRLVESTPSDRGLADHQWLESAKTKDYNLQVSKSRRGQSIDTVRGQSQKQAQLSVPELTSADSHQSQANTMPPARSGRYGSSTTSQGRKANNLFMADESDSDDDPLRFRL